MLFGALRTTSPLSGGLLWKIPWRISSMQKRRHRERLRAVDGVVDTLTRSLTAAGTAIPKSVARWFDEMPREEQMRPKDKYTVFSRYARKYRKGIHKVPKWTRVSQRINPPGY